MERGARREWTGVRSAARERSASVTLALSRSDACRSRPRRRARTGPLLQKVDERLRVAGCGGQRIVVEEDVRVARRQRRDAAGPGPELGTRVPRPGLASLVEADV